MPCKAINFAEKLCLFAELWHPKVIAEMNNYQFKIEKIQGDFIWHDHKDTDEIFIALDGALRIDFCDGMWLPAKCSSCRRRRVRWQFATALGGTDNT
jgi:hypothetical protein